MIPIAKPVMGEAEAAKAGVVVTNHSVVLMDALQGDENTSPILGDYDFLIVDEAHDLPQAALSAFEFTLDERALSQVASIASGLERVLRPRAVSKKMEREFTDSFGAFRKIVESVKFDLSSLATFAPRSGILAAAPSDVAAFPSVAAKMSEPMQERVFPLAASILSACKEVDAMARRVLKKEGDEVTTELGESALQYRQFLAEFALNCKSLANPEDGKGKKWTIFHQLLRPTWKFLNLYLVRLGVLDGIKGIIISYLNALGVWERYSELKKLRSKS
jgi:Rad3-related DNA helicase